MKAITLWQPWASLIAEGVKTIETRSWTAPDPLIGERIAIHAAARKPSIDDTMTITTLRGGGLAPIFALEARLWPRGAVVATAVLDDCVPITWLGYQQTSGTKAVTYRDGAAKPLELTLWDGNGGQRDVSDQAPYGIFAYERWAWLLRDVEPCDPIPARGRQRVWNWAPENQKAAA